MTTSKSSTGFEYRNKKSETPFETFLRYTDEKERSAVELAKVLAERLSDGARLLDIGTGNGEYLHLALSRLKDVDDIELTLVEPSDDLVRQLKARFKGLLPVRNLRIIQSSLEELESSELFDVILMSHLFYHVPRSLWAEQLKKVVALLKPGGALLIVLRGEDDVYDFKMAFKPLLFDPSFKALTIDDVLDVFPENEGIQITKQSVTSELRIPLEQNVDDTIAIIEFFLNKEWQEMPRTIQEDAVRFIEAKGSIFKQLDCIAVVERN